MSKVKIDPLTHYELLFIVPNKFTEDELPAIIDRVKRIITDNSGVITTEENWGKRKLAYQIGSYYYGYYTLVEFDLDRGRLNELNRTLRLMSEILRHQIVKKHIKTAAEMEKDKKIAAKIAAKVVKEKEQEEAPKEVKAPHKVDLKELDEKLDKILETDDLL